MLVNPLKVVKGKNSKSPLQHCTRTFGVGSLSLAPSRLATVARRVRSSVFWMRAASFGKATAPTGRLMPHGYRLSQGRVPRTRWCSSAQSTSQACHHDRGHHAGRHRPPSPHAWCRLTGSYRQRSGASASGYQARTSITELSVPCWFKTFSRASRSGIHSPSRTNLYS